MPVRHTRLVSFSSVWATTTNDIAIQIARARNVAGKVQPRLRSQVTVCVVSLPNVCVLVP